MQELPPQWYGVPQGERRGDLPFAPPSPDALYDMGSHLIEFNNSGFFRHQFCAALSP